MLCCLAVLGILFNAHRLLKACDKIGQLKTIINEIRSEFANVAIPQDVTANVQNPQNGDGAIAGITANIGNISDDQDNGSDSDDSFNMY